MIKIKNQGYISLHVTKINELHFMTHVTSFHALHRILHHFMYHFMLFYHKNSLHTHSCHLALKKKEKDQNATLFNRAPAEWNVPIRRIKMPPEWGIFQTIKMPPRAGVLLVRCNFARESYFSRKSLVAFHQTLTLESCKA